MRSTGSCSRLRAVSACSALALVSMLSSCAAPPPAVSELDAALSAASPGAVRSHVRFLAHDLLRGRSTGEPGYEIGREYVVAQFTRLRLQPLAGGSYLQPIELLTGNADTGSELRAGQVRIKAPEATFAPDWLGSRPTITGEGVFVGLGIVTADRNDYGDADVAGKVVFVLPGVPSGWEEDPARAYLSRVKNETAIRRGAAAVVSLRVPRETPPPSVVPPARPAGPAVPRNVPMVLADGTSPSIRPEVSVGSEASRRLLAAWGLDPSTIPKSAETVSAPRPVGLVTITRSHEIGRVQTWNVVGIVPGTDEALKNQSVVFTAHLDHLGVGEPDEQGDAIFNGAHDNALGVGKVLAAAEALVRLKPRRSIVFAIVAAEEKGLLGAWYYVKHPAFALDQIAAAINHDGGREGAASDDVLAFGSELSTLNDTLAEVAKEAGMSVSRDQGPPFTPSLALLFRSDHYPFLVAGVPAIYLMDGYTVGGDPERGRKEWQAYLDKVNHKQRDNFSEDWSFESPARMAALSARLAWRLANQAELPQVRPAASVPKQRGVPAKPFFSAGQ